MLAPLFPHLVQPVAQPSIPDTPSSASTAQPTPHSTLQPTDPDPEPPIFTKGKRNALNVIYKGFRHCREGKYNESTYMKCVNQQPKCPGRLILVNQQVTKFTPHTCQPEPAKIAVHLVREKIKTAVVSSWPLLPNADCPRSSS